MPNAEAGTHAQAPSLDILNPATGEVIDSVAEACREDVKAAVDRAEAVFLSWRVTPAIARARLLRRAADLMYERASQIAAVLTAEQGKPLAEAEGEVRYAASYFEWFAGEAERSYGRVVPPTDPTKRILVMREPVGVTAAITPWNFPAAMLTRKLGPAIAAGCTSVVKPAQETPLTAIEICRALTDAGAPDGLVSLIVSSQPAMVADQLLGDPRVRKLSFTGSTPVGQKLISRSAEHVTKLSLELGGHAPFIIFDDCDLDAAVDGLMASKFRNAGQTCICVNRVFVQKKLRPTLLERLTERTSALRVGPGSEPGVEIGPLINAAAVKNVSEHVQDALDNGAQLTTGGRAPSIEGHFFAPTVLDGITPQMLIARDETFGPVVGLTEFEHEDEVVESANATPYGLAAYVYTRDYARMLRVAERLQAGVVGANDGAPSAPNAPFGGVKASGYGREGGAEGIEDYLDTKYVSIGGVSGSPRVGGR